MANNAIAVSNHFSINIVTIVLNAFTCHVLILTPFIESCMLTSLTVMFETQALVLSFPKLPMLIPCPGPQLTLCTYTFEHPVCIEMQSSPACHS